MMEEPHEEKPNPTDANTSNASVPPTGHPELKQIRTFQGDVALALERQKESLVSIQQSERAKLGAAGEIFHEERGVKQKILFALGSLVLVAVAAVGLWYTYQEYAFKTAVPVITTPDNRFFSIDSEEKLDVGILSRLDFINIISSFATNVPEGETRQFQLFQNEEGLTSTKLFSLLETRAPGALIRALDPLSMVGSYGQSVFLIFKLSSFENTFAGMLYWEKDMAEDIGPLFATRELLRDSTSTPVFIDITDRNKDVRALVSETQTVLLYSFFDNNMLIITDDIQTLRVLIERLTREKLSR